MLPRWLSREFFAEAIEILRILKEYNVKTVLDVGSGSGMLGWILQGLGYKVQGIDIDCKESMISCKEHNLREGIPFPGNSFDAVVSQHVIEHFTLKEQVGLLSEKLRVSRKLVVVITPNKRFHWKPPDGPYTPDHKFLHDRKSLKELFDTVCSSINNICYTKVYELQNFVYASPKYFKLTSILTRILRRPTLIGIIVKGV